MARGLDVLGVEPTRALGGLVTTVVAGGAGAVTYLAAARVFRLHQLNYLIDSVLRRR